MSQSCAELQITGGAVCCVPDSNALLTPFVLREQGGWFEDEVAFVQRLVQPGMHVVDIGANYGTYTLLMASLVGKDGVVHAFEPAEAPLTMLRRSLKRNAFPWVKLHAVGVSNRCGTASLSTTANPELNSLNEEQLTQEKIDLVTLDSSLGSCEKPIVFIKMDAEGEEERILEGADAFFAKQSPLIMFELKHGTTINEGLCEAFQRRGFLIYRLLPGPCVLAPIPVGESLDPYLLNVFAVRPASEQMLKERGLLVPLRLSLPDSIGKLAVNEVIKQLAASPWLEGIPVRWEPDASMAGWDEHRRAVGMACAVETGTLTAGERVACLRQALQACRRALRAAVTGSRLFTFARIAFDLGYRGEALSALSQIVGPIRAGQDVAPTFREPFLLPLRHHESLRGLPLTELVSIVALETHAWKSAYSAYFASEQAVSVYRHICTLPKHDARSARTLALLEDLRRPRAVTIA